MHFSIYEIAKGRDRLILVTSKNIRLTGKTQLVVRELIKQVGPLCQASLSRQDAIEDSDP